MNALLLSAVVLSAPGGWTQIHLTNQLQCKTPYVMTVGIPEGQKGNVIRIEKDGKSVVEKQLEAATAAEAAIFDADDSGCEEALVDVTADGRRFGALVTFPKGKPEILMFPPTGTSAAKAKRMGAKVRAFHQKGEKLCITDYTLKSDTARKAFEDCY